MKKPFLIVSIFIIAVFFACCGGRKTNISIKGNIKIPEKSIITLSRLELKTVEPIDTAQIGTDGEFSLRAYEEETALYVVVFEQTSIYLVVKPGDNLKISIDNSLNPTSYYVEGSAESRLVRELVFEQEKVLKAITEISIAYEKSKENPLQFEKKKTEFDSLYAILLQRHKDFTIQFIHKNPHSLACIFALYQNFGKTNQPLFDKFEDIKVFNFVDSNLTALYPETPAVIALNRDVTYTKEQLEQKRITENIYRINRLAPEFEALTIDTTTISLAGYNGKSVLFVFFAVWNKPSAEIAINTNKLFSTYRSKGFEVVGVSFDNSVEKLRFFVDTNNIQFPVVCDYAYWDSKYVKLFGIMEIPNFILLNQYHIVSKRDITINELKTTLEEWDKNNLF